jgi:hypothetical protein
MVRISSNRSNIQTGNFNFCDQQPRSYGQLSFKSAKNFEALPEVKRVNKNYNYRVKQKFLGRLKLDV